MSPGVPSYARRSQAGFRQRTSYCKPLIDGTTPSPYTIGWPIFTLLILIRHREVCANARAIGERSGLALESLLLSLSSSPPGHLAEAPFGFGNIRVGLRFTSQLVTSLLCCRLWARDPPRFGAPRENDEQILGCG
jgi:hypothetical protein